MILTTLNYIAIGAVICFIVALVRALVVLQRKRALRDIEKEAEDFSFTPVLFATSKGLFIRKVKGQQNRFGNKANNAVGIATEFSVEYCDNYCTNCTACK